MVSIWMVSIHQPHAREPASFLPSWSCRKTKCGVIYVYSDSRCQLMQIFTCPWCIFSSWTDWLLYSSTPADRLVSCVNDYCHHTFTLFLFLLLQLKVRAKSCKPLSNLTLTLLLTLILIRREMNHIYIYIYVHKLKSRWVQLSAFGVSYH